MFKSRFYLLLLAAALVVGVSAFFLHQQTSPASSIGAPGRPAALVKQARLRDELLRRLNQYEGERLRHNLVLVEEIVCAYMRVDSEECMDVLRSAHALFLISSHSLAPAASQIDLSDFAGVLRVASTADGRTGDLLITEAFRKEIENDPEKAFGYLQLLPRYLLEELSYELACSWGAKNGPAAAAAFYKEGLKGSFNAALFAWSQKDLEPAFKFISSVVEVRRRDSLMNAFFISSSQRAPENAVRLLSEHNDLPYGVFGSLLSAFGDLHDNDDQKMLSAAALLPSNAQQAVYYSMAQNWASHESDTFAIQAASRLPVSAFSLDILGKAAAKVAMRAKDPYMVAEELTDPYQRTAVAGAISKAVVAANGLEGMAGMVRHGVSSHSAEWLEAAALIVASPPSAGENAGTPLDWKSLPQDVLEALANHASRNWPPEAAAALQLKLP